jgi:hypothetical protein
VKSHEIDPQLEAVSESHKRAMEALATAQNLEVSCALGDKVRFRVLIRIEVR